eukprot:TRINITY_DN27210_c0_g1_i1.p1 TRINITY_DN27210_c0_g1~~TRINITY_DN27210_c0_g1_i1.p1  ORF type:complete len:805 (+),score=229.66 TRINITY_DN27210_c0_g1_i1:243-2417(+)
MATDAIKCDADAAFYVKCRFLGRTSRWMTYTQTVDTRNNLYRLLARFRRAGLAGEETFTACILFFTTLGMGQRAHAVFDMALEDGIRPNSRMYNFLLGGYANEGKWQMVYQLWAQMVRNEILPTPHSFNVLLRAQAKAGNKLEVFEMMKTLSPIMKPNTMTWTILLSACTSSEEAFAILGDMKRHDILPDTRTVGAIIDACVLSGDVNRAESLIRQAERQWGIACTTGTYNTLMNVYKEAGDFGGVKEVFRRMQVARCRPDTLSYNLLVTSSALSQDVHTGRAAFSEAESLGVARTLHMNTSVTAVFGYSGDYENAQRCWESRPGKGPSAKRTEPQLANIRECYVAARLLSYPRKTTALMKELYRLRDPTLIDNTNPYILQCFLRACISLRGWGVKPLWRIMCQVRAPKKALAAIDTRRHQAVLHTSLDNLLATAICLWIKDHPYVEKTILREADRNPWEASGITYLDLLEDVFAKAMKRGPSMAAHMLPAMNLSYSSLGLVRRAMVRYEQLLKGGASYRAMYPHARTFREMFKLNKNHEAVDMCNEVIVQYHNTTLWRVPTAQFLTSLAEEGVKPSELSFALIREKQTRAQSEERRRKREQEMIIRNVPGVSNAEEDHLVGIVSDQMPFISSRLNEVDEKSAQPHDGKETIDTLLAGLARSEPIANGLVGQADPKSETLPLTSYLEHVVDGTLDKFYTEEIVGGNSGVAHADAEEFHMEDAGR